MSKSVFSFLAPFAVFIFAIFCGFIVYRAAWFNIDKHFSLLAESFLKGDLFLNPINLPDGDYVDFMGRQYLFFGPMPSIILAPFVFVFGRNFPQMTLSIVSLIVSFSSIFLICRKLNFSKADAFWLANFFVFGTVLYFVGLINISAYVVQAIGTAFMALSLLEYFTKKRWLLIGILVAAAGATRVTLFGMSVFFLLEIFRNRRKINFGRSLIYLILPIVLSVTMLGVYNSRRFHTFLDTGYTKNVSVLDKNYYNNQLGWFSPVHIGTNLYLLLFKSPDPVLRNDVELSLVFPYLKANHLGLAIWFTSPLFLYLLQIKKADYTYSALAGIGVLLLPSLVYFGMGASQFGYRYSLDFIPLLFIILLSAFKSRLPDSAKLIIAGGIVFNCFYMFSIYNSYPLLDFFDYLW